MHYLKRAWCYFFGHKLAHAGVMNQPVMCQDESGGFKTMMVKYELEACKVCHGITATFSSTEEMASDLPSRANWWGAGDGELH
jgi:hypothetical protein